MTEKYRLTHRGPIPEEELTEYEIELLKMVSQMNDDEEDMPGGTQPVSALTDFFKSAVK